MRDREREHVRARVCVFVFINVCVCVCERERDAWGLSVNHYDDSSMSSEHSFLASTQTWSRDSVIETHKSMKARTAL